MRRGPRWIHAVYAWALGYFWLPCPVCGRMFGGHETEAANHIPTETPGLYDCVCSHECAKEGA